MAKRPRRAAAGWSVALSLALITACSSSPERSGSGGAPDGQTPGASAEARIGGIIDNYMANDGTGVLEVVRAVLVNRGDRPLVERYYDSSAEATSDVASVTKSVMSILVGIALDQGRLKGVEQTLAELLPAHAPGMSPEVAGVTLRQLLTMTAGLPDDEAKGADDYTTTGNWVATILSRGLDQPPGEGFGYSSAGSHLLSAILVQATGRPVLDFAREYLFDPLGIATVPAAEPLAVVENVPVYDAAGFAWPVDPQGNHTGGMLLKIGAPDMAKLGQLMLGGGRWQGEQIVPAEWVAESTRALVPAAGDVPAADYGYQWWVTTAADNAAFAAVGFGGQLIEVVPDLDLVVVVSSTIPEFTRLGGGTLLAMVDQLLAPVLSP